MEPLFTVEKISPRAGLELGTARSVGQRLTHCATGASIPTGLLIKSAVKVSRRLAAIGDTTTLGTAYVRRRPALYCRCLILLWLIYDGLT